MTPGNFAVNLKFVGVLFTQFLTMTTWLYHANNISANRNSQYWRVERTLAY